MSRLTINVHYFTKGELVLWIGSLILIIVSFFVFGNTSYLTLIASLIGVTSLIYAAKGNPVGPLLMVVFSLLYGIISFSFAYYGEMLTYLGMTMPMSVAALISWKRNPYKDSKAEVKINRLFMKEIVFMFLLALIVTVIFYFILKAFDTANLLFSTISVTTSFIAVYLTFRRSPYYAVAYAANDVILIILWVLATTENREYLSVVICFLAFLVNDLYGFISWKKIEKRQNLNAI